MEVNKTEPERGTPRAVLDNSLSPGRPGGYYLYGGCVDSPRPTRSQDYVDDPRGGIP